MSACESGKFVSIVTHLSLSRWPEEGLRGTDLELKVYTSCQVARAWGPIRDVCGRKWCRYELAVRSCVDATLNNDCVGNVSVMHG